MTEQQPEIYLSFIIAVRNDNYGGDFNSRLSFSVNTLSCFVQKYRLSSELILVNYNLIEDRPPLTECVDWPEKHTYLRIRIIQVPPLFHQKYLAQGMRKPVPMFEFIAKNIGIVRAKGQFLLCTNADIVFSESLIAFFAQKTLQKGKLYRCDRYDFHKLADNERKDSPEHLEKNIQNKVFKFFVQDGTFTLTYPKNIYTRLKILKKYNLFRRWYYFTMLKVPYTRPFRFIPRITREQEFLFHYHCNASGDMTLMDRSDWQDIKGYPEDTWISTHTDSLMVICGVASGRSLEVIPFPVYHQHHERRFDFSKKNDDMDQMYTRLLNEANTMLRSGKPQINKHHDWGLMNEKLDEIDI